MVYVLLVFELILIGSLIGIYGLTFGTGVITIASIITLGIIVINFYGSYAESNIYSLFKWTCNFLYIGLVMSFIIIEILIILGSRVSLPDEEVSVDYVLILGAGLKDGKEVSNRLQLRLDKGIAYMSNNPKTKVIVSGGQGADELISEAAAMSSYMREKGIPEDVILLENESTSTYENVRFSKELIEQLEGSSNDKIVLIVTSDYHMFRASYLASEFGIKHYCLPNETPLGIRINYMLREYLAFIKDYIYTELLA